MTAPNVDAARLRGGFVGACSGAITIAAHGLGGGETPSENALVLLLVTCAAVGVWAGSAAASGRLPVLVLQLCAGQAIGHIAITIAAEHSHDLLPSTSMLAAHCAAALVCGALIFSAERLYRVTASTLRQVVVVLAPLVVDEAPLPALPAYRPDVVLRLLVSSGLGTRGPPA
ncbi:hypothetical protein [Antrihabitans stalactiti]|uniref:hypothetical protein n=1 Tax=Antrihabitans stalactiti TaxID=2584121 RepID=UPI0030B7FB0B